MSDKITTKDSKDIVNLISDIDEDGKILNISEIHKIDQSEAELQESTIELEDEDKDNLYNEEVSPEGIYTISTSKATKKGKEYIKRNLFICSVAKGQTMKFSSKKTYKTSISIDAGVAIDVASLKSGLKSSVSYTITTTFVFNTKGMAKKHNSREYRVKFINQRYTRTQTKKLKVVGKVVAKNTVTLSVPVKYSTYTLDSYVK